MNGDLNSNVTLNVFFYIYLYFATNTKTAYSLKMLEVFKWLYIATYSKFTVFQNCLTHLAIGHPLELFPALLVYIIFSMRIAEPWTSVLMKKKNSFTYEC